jgi:C4-dicarboxylate-specific signal transduction histidine kinase
MIHPDLGFDDDVRQMLDQHAELARLLLEDPEAACSDMGVRLFNELQLLRDLKERRELEKAKRALEVELAHVSRVAMMGELTASIAHELRQPLSAAVTNATTCQHWLAEDSFDVARARERRSG